MKIHLIPFYRATAIAAIVLTFALMLAHNLGAQTEGDPTGRINQASNLLAQGQPKAALAILDTINTSESYYPMALTYKALCLFQTDRLKFCKAMKSPMLQLAGQPPELQQELQYDQIETLFVYRKFEELRPCLENFIASYTNSPLMHTVLEYQMATWYERGMKKIVEANESSDPQIFQKRYNDGQSNLLDFLNLAAVLNQTNYLAFPKRSLVHEIWQARIALGEEKQTQDQTPDMDKDEEAFTSVKMFERLQPRALWSIQETEDNVKRMNDFLNKYPSSIHAKRVRYDLAAISFPMVEALYPEAYNDERAKDTNSASAIKMKAQAFFQMTESLTNELYEDSAAGIGPGDVFDAKADLLHGYCLEKNYSEVLNLAGQWALNSVPGGVTWLMAKTYRGAAFQSMMPANLTRLPLLEALAN